MKILTIINGITEKELYEQAERYAFREGLRTLSLEQFLQKSNMGDDGLILILLDGKALQAMPKDIVLVFSIRFPVVLIPASVGEWTWMEEESGVICSRILYPFHYHKFCEVVRESVDPEIWRERILVFGRLEISPSGRSVKLDGVPLAIRQLDFDILLMLFQNMGRVISRDYMNRNLPKRQRTTQRNIDMHISSIRQKSGLGNVICCVRSVGYRLSEEELYNWTLGSKV